ncbi:MAG TPA: aryl-sulfate sulfotransferase [Candidatus Acidoferrum sp.]
MQMTPQPVAISVTPQSAALAPGQTTQFTAMVTASNPAVTWSVNGVMSGNSTVGTIDSTGKFTAPSTAQGEKVTISATSMQDATKSAAATARVVAPGSVAPTANPQVALFTISPPDDANVSVQFGTDTTYGLTTWTQPTTQAGAAVSLFVAGMRASTLYHMRGVVQFSDGTQFMDADRTFTTAALPAAKIPTITATTTPGMTPQPGIEILDITTTTQFPVAATDLSGNIIWTYDPGLPNQVEVNPIKLLPNGHFLLNFSGPLADGSDSVIQEVDLSGTLIWQMTVAQLNTALSAATCSGCNITVTGTHHDFVLLPNGHLIVLAGLEKSISGVTGPVTGDVIIDLDQNHKPVWIWNEFDHLDINRRPFMFPDWTHTNAILYSPDDGNLIISIRHQNWLLKIDYNNGAGAGDILWHLGFQGDFALQGVTDPTDPSNWFFAQHGPSFVTANTSGKFSLVLFDNGDDRVFPSGVTCGTTGQPPCLFSTVPQIDLDESAKTATISFHPTAQFYSFFGGNAEVLKNGNVEFDEASTNSTATAGSIFEITKTSTPQTVWRMDVSTSLYRGFRLPSLYPGVQW